MYWNNCSQEMLMHNYQKKRGKERENGVLSGIKWWAVEGMIRKILPLAEQTKFTTTHHDDVIQYIHASHGCLWRTVLSTMEGKEQRWLGISRLVLISPLLIKMATGLECWWHHSDCFCGDLKRREKCWSQKMKLRPAWWACGFGSWLAKERFCPFEVTGDLSAATQGWSNAMNIALQVQHNKVQDYRTEIKTITVSDGCSW